MKEYQLIKEQQELINEIKRIKEIMGVMYSPNTLTENTNLIESIDLTEGTELTEIRPTLLKIMEKFGFTKAELSAESLITGLVSKFEKKVLASGEGSLITRLTKIGEKLASPIAAERTLGRKMLTQFAKEQANFNLLLDIFKQTDLKAYELKASKFVENRLNQIGPDILEQANKIRRNEGPVKFLEFCKSINIVGRLDKYFLDYKPFVNGNFGKMDAFRKFIESITPKRMKTFQRVFLRTFNTQKTLAEEFKNVARQAEIAMEKGYDPQYYFKKMKDILQASKKWADQAPKNVFEGTSGKGGTVDGWKTLMPESVAREIAETEGGYEEFFKAFKSDRKAWTPIMEEIKGFWNVQPFRIPFGRKVMGKYYTPGFLMFKRLDLIVPQRLVNFVLFQDPRTWVEIEKGLIQRGVGGAIRANIIGRLVITGWVLPIVCESLIDTVKATSSFVQFAVNELLELFEVNKELNIIEWNKEATLEGAFDQWWEDCSSKFPKDMFHFLNPWNHTYLDEVGRFLKGIVIGAAQLTQGEFSILVRTKYEEYTLKERQKLINEHPELVQMGFTLDVLKDPFKFMNALKEVKNHNHSTQITQTGQGSQTSTYEILSSDEINNYIHTSLNDLVPSQTKVNVDNSVDVYVEGNPEPVATIIKQNGQVTIK